MQLTNVFIAMLAAAGTAVAAPVQESVVENVVERASYAAPQGWTLQAFKRSCGPLGRVCNYSYSINLNNGSPATACAYTINDPTNASRAGYQNIKCGAFTIGSNWSGQFGEGNGFQTLSVVKGREIIYPSYTDRQLQSGNAVVPDQNWRPQGLP